MTEETRQTGIASGETWYHEQLDAMLKSLNSIDKSLVATNAQLASLIQITQDHEARIRVIERWQDRITPILAGLTFVCGALFTQLIERLI